MHGLKNLLDEKISRLGVQRKDGRDGLRLTEEIDQTFDTLQ